ncbi:MAG: excinuclease ABC subunit A [Myxococcota bacterium]|jgi:excinuclease ABC subunit A
MRHIKLRGARDNNLTGIDLDIPLGHWTAVTGPSGSGKSTLVFDTIVREGQRRFLGSLSSKARQYLGKLGRADVDHLDPVPAAIAIGAGTFRAHARSTVGTLTGALDLLRLLYARQAVSPDRTALTRSHFSFNHPTGQCPACVGLGIEDHVDPELIIADARKSIRDGALVPTLANGYTVYSQVTLEVMNDICAAHGFDVDTPWEMLTDAQHQVILYGTQALTVPFGKHSIESRMKWAGITARPREEGFYKGLVPVIAETLTRNRNPNILRFVRSVPCSACSGSRLGPAGHTAHINGLTLPELLAQPIGEFPDLVRGSQVFTAIWPSLEPRVRHLVALDLGHLSLDRTSASLSDGEAQRVRLVAQISAHLSGVLYAFDEPTLGVHPSEQAGLTGLLWTLRDRGNTILTVEHDPDMVRRADHWIDIGPAGGTGGGRVQFAGDMPENPLGVVPEPRIPRPWTAAITLSGATLHNLKEASLTVPLGVLTVLTGRSGAGKTSLVRGTFLPALLGERGGPFTSLDGVPEGLVVHAVDASPIGRTPRSTPATWSGLFDRIRKRFAKASGLGASTFSHNTTKGRCPHCEGQGVERITLHLLEDATTTCPVCSGGRYRQDVLQTRVWNLNIAEVLQLTADNACTVFSSEEDLLPTVSAMVQLGLGYLTLGQSSTTLSRGEAQRLKLATLLAKPSRGARLIVLDEPDRGLHPTDVARLLASLDQLTKAGTTVLAISHHRHVWAAADNLLTINAGVCPTDPRFCRVQTSETYPAEAPSQRDDTTLLGVRTNGLNLASVTFPRDQVTVITGPSGCGKSSLAFGTLATEAQRRFAESLPFAARRMMRRVPRADLDHAIGLTPTLALQQRTDDRPGRRSTVATLTEMGPLLRLLWSRVGTVDGVPTSLTMAHFSPNQTLGACPECSGLGTVPKATVDLLVTVPHLPLFGGAMAGTRPGRFFGEPGGQYAATLRAAAPHVDWDVPFDALSDTERDIALNGNGEQEVSVVWTYTRGKRSGEHRFTGPWVGLLALVETEANHRTNARAATEWSTPLHDTPCPTCHGERMSPQARAVTVDNQTLPHILSLALSALPVDLAASVTAIGDELQARIADLRGLGLDHLSLDRRSDSLSTGELQRVRLAGVLRSGLTGTTVVLDEPDSGLHALDVEQLSQRTRALAQDGNTVVVVSHRETTQREADVELALAEAPIVEPAPAEEVDSFDIQLFGCHANTLQDIDIDLPNRGVVAVTGVSGSGKTSLVFDVLAASVEGNRSVNCRRTVGLERFSRVISSRSRRTDPLSALGLLPALQSVFAAATSLSKAYFSFRSAKGACPECKGAGVERVAMDGLGDLALPCKVCDGSRYRPEVLIETWNGLTIADALTVRIDAFPTSGHKALDRAMSVLTEVGLGHLSLGRRPGTLSGGEVQRLRLAEVLLAKRIGPQLIVVDEPGRGLHDSDIAALTHVYRMLADAGDLVVFTAHRLSVIRSADHVIDLGPGSGPTGGCIVETGHAAALHIGATARALRF